MSNSEATMAKRKRKMTPDERAELKEFRRRSDENLRRLRELVELGLPEPGIRLARIARLLFDTGAVSQRGFVHGVGAPVRACRAAAEADGEHDARTLPRADDRVVDALRAMEEVPLAKRALLALDDGQRLAGEHEEILLVVLVVVHRHRLAGAEDGDVDPELLEIRRALEACALELAEKASALAVPPLGSARVEDEPALSFRDESVLGRNELRLGNHQLLRAVRSRRRQ